MTSLIPFAGTLTMTSREIAELTGKRHDHVMRDIRAMIARFEEHNLAAPDLGAPTNEHNSVGPNLNRAKDADSNLNWHCETEHYIDEQGKARQMYRLDKNTTLCLVAGYDPIPRMRIIQRLDALESGKAQVPQAVSYLDAKLKIGQVAKDWLRMSDTSAIRMLSDIAISEGISPAFLPKYVDEPLTKSMTSLLDEHGKPVKISQAFTALIAMGLVEVLERQGSKQLHHFNSLTAAGLEYGRNETSPQNPRQTQIQFYVNRFPELLDRIISHVRGENAA